MVFKFVELHLFDIVWREADFAVPWFLHKLWVIWQYLGLVDLVVHVTSGQNHGDRVEGGLSQGHRCLLEWRSLDDEGVHGQGVLFLWSFAAEAEIDLIRQLRVGRSDVVIDGDGKLQRRQFLQAFINILQSLRTIAYKWCIFLVIFELLNDPCVEGPALN